MQMNFIKGMPNIKILKDNKYMFDITTVQKFDEKEDKIILQCAEDIPEFMRGFVCDMDCRFQIVNENCENKYERNSINKDLVLVYINKDLQYNYMPSFEYIFFK
jgi:hypothetical protein